MTSVFGSERSSLNEYEWLGLSWIHFLLWLMTIAWCSTSLMIIVNQATSPSLYTRCKYKDNNAEATNKAY